MHRSVRSVVKAFTPPIVIDGIRRVQRGARRSQSPDPSLPMSQDSEAHRRAVGGLWETIGTLQFRYLVDSGLEPRHRLLDIGCGSLRGGVHFIEYLHDGNYYGIDASEALLRAARRIELPQYGLTGKTIHLVCRSDFDFSVFGEQFDYAIAQSVFTHLPWNSILRCLVNVEKVLRQGGRFFATFFEDEDGLHRTRSILHEVGGKVTYPDRDPYHYEFDVFQELANRVGLKVHYVGDWHHPRHQMMMTFVKP